MTEPLRDPFEQSQLDDQSMSTLLQQARNGDHAAQNTLLDQLHKYLAFVANHQMDRELQAKMGPSDVVQQSMIRAVENLETFRGNTVNEFRAWIRQILVNEAKQVKRDFRAQKRDVFKERRIADSLAHGPVDLADSLPTPGTKALAEEQTRAIEVALEKLSEQDRQIIQWRNWDGLEFDEIANRLNISSSTASRKWYRALVAFKLHLAVDNE